MLTVYASWHLCGVRSDYVIEVNGCDAVGEMKEKVAEAIKIPVEAFTVMLEGDEMRESAQVHETPLTQGCTLEVVLRRPYVARMELKQLGLRCDDTVLRKDVIGSDGVAGTEEEKARISQAMIDCCEGSLTFDGALVEAAKRGYLQVVQLLVSDSNMEKTLRIAAEYGWVAIVEALLSLGANVNAADELGFTPIAAAVEHLGVVEVLIHAGADVNTSDNYHDTPLHHAANTSSTDLISLLVQHGAKVNRTNRNGDTPLHKAVVANRVDITQQLIQNGADPALRNKSGNTPLDAAILHSREEIVEYLRSLPKTLRP
eukprot:TRINITY_DN11279_c0_g1_i1.p1 TRINITY_DN11279_c0_g1~~TRINITY_DN11279_c0_g1_i1.p1  ORF type:complete len:315 (+),score=58.31 TRINITY_DN11279_c0_g1_i1:93-1037(+)